MAASCHRSEPAATVHGDASHRPDAILVEKKDASRPAVPAYVFDPSPPRDLKSLPLLKALGREAKLIVECEFESADDIFKDPTDLYVFLDVVCTHASPWRGSIPGDAIRFLWQVERGSRISPPKSKLLVFLKPRKRPLSPPESIEWVTLEIGVLPLTDWLRTSATQMYGSHGRKR